MEEKTSSTRRRVVRRSATVTENPPLVTVNTHPKPEPPTVQHPLELGLLEETLPPESGKMLTRDEEQRHLRIDIAL